jgi:transposase
VLKPENDGSEGGVLSARVLTRALGVDAKTVRVEGAGMVGDQIEIRARPRWRQRWCCPRCGRRCPGYDAPAVPRRWRALDFGAVQAFVVCAVPRVSCPAHGVLVAGVPWARPGARHTRAFEQQAAWCAVEMSASAAAKLLRCSWRTIGSMVARVEADLRAGADRLEGLRRIGVDEVSYRRRWKYLTVVVDHDRRRLVWAAKGATEETLDGFFDALGAERAAALTHVSADAATWIRRVVTRRAPQARLCADPFHIVAWVTDALDQVRRQVWNTHRTRQPRGAKGVGEGKVIADSRWALWKNPEHLTDTQRDQLGYLLTMHPDLIDAWVLKEGLRRVFSSTGDAAIETFDHWVDRAVISDLPPFQRLADKLARHRPQIVETLTHGLSNALIESTNTKIRLITRRGFGFRNTDALLALLRLSLGGYRPELPT